MGLQGQRGYTLLELVIVVSVVALIAAIAVPASNSTGSSRQLELIAEEFAAAIRFARSESMRTGEPHGFQFTTAQYRIRVFSADTSGNPWTWIWDVYQPVTRALYDYSYPGELVGTGTPVSHSPVYRGSCNQPGVVYFNASGTPWCLEPETVLLDSYRLDIVLGSDSRSVGLDGLTGRVTVQ